MGLLPRWDGKPGADRVSSPKESLAVPSRGLQRTLTHKHLRPALIVRSRSCNHEHAGASDGAPDLPEAVQKGSFMVTTTRRKARGPTETTNLRMRAAREARGKKKEPDCWESGRTPLPQDARRAPPACKHRLLLEGAQALGPAGRCRFPCLQHRCRDHAQASCELGAGLSGPTESLLH
jgi:hypothetical protein